MPLLRWSAFELGPWAAVLSTDFIWNHADHYVKVLVSLLCPAQGFAIRANDVVRSRVRIFLIR